MRLTRETIILRHCDSEHCPLPADSFLPLTRSGQTLNYCTFKRHVSGERQPLITQGDSTRINPGQGVEGA